MNLLLSLELPFPLDKPVVIEDHPLLVLSDLNESRWASIDRALAPSREIANRSGLIASLGDTVCHSGDGDE